MSYDHQAVCWSYHLLWFIELFCSGHVLVDRDMDIKALTFSAVKAARCALVCYDLHGCWCQFIRGRFAKSSLTTIFSVSHPSSLKSSAVFFLPQEMCVLDPNFKRRRVSCHPKGEQPNSCVVILWPTMGSFCFSPRWAATRRTFPFSLKRNQLKKTGWIQF